MPRVAVTGHRGLYGVTARDVDRELRDRLRDFVNGEHFVGVSCLADGADAMFAAAVLDMEGSLTAVVPAARYRDGLPVEHWPECDRLLAAATNVIRLDHIGRSTRARFRRYRRRGGLRPL